MAEFNPDQYLAEKLGPQQDAPAGFDPDKYLAEKTGTEPQSDKFDWGSPVLSTFKKAGQIGVAGLEKAGDLLERYSAAPTRSAISAGLQGENPLSAGFNQMGKDASLAPSGQKIAGQLGIPSKDVDISINPEMAAENEKYGISNTANPQKMAGGLIEATADPSLYLPLSKLGGKQAVGLLKEAPEALKASSEVNAIKQSGAMLKDFRKIMSKGQTEEVGQYLLNAKVAGEDGKAIPLMSAGDKAEDIAQKSAIKKAEVGDKLGNLYDSAKKAIDDYIVSKDADPKVLDKLSNATPTVDQLRKEIVPQVKDAMKNQAYSGPINQLNSYFDDLKDVHGDKPLDLFDLHDIKSKIGQNTFNTPEMRNRKQAFVEAYKTVADKINAHMEALDSVLQKAPTKDGAGIADQLKDLNKEFSIISTINPIAQDRTARMAANRAFSPSDYMAGALGELSGHEGGEGLLRGATAAVANKLGRERGPGLLARAAEAGSNAAKYVAPTIGGPAQGLIETGSAVKPLSRLTRKKDGK